MTLKEIKEHYKLHKFRENKNQFLVFSNIKGSCNRMVYKYFCLITKVGNKFFVDGFEPTSNFKVLKIQIESFVKSLPYDSMYYNPHFVTGLFEDLIIFDYMCDIGFKKEGYHNNSDGFVLKAKNAYGYSASTVYVSFYGLDPFDCTDRESGKRRLSDKVDISLRTGNYSWVNVTTKRNVEDIKSGIDSLLKPLLISESVNNFSVADKMVNENMDLEITFKKMSNLSINSSEDYRQELKIKLLELADKL